MSFTIFQNEKTPFQAIKTTTSKSRKIHIFPKVFPWFWSKNDHFSNFSFQVIEAWKMSFTISQNKKKAFLGQKKQEVQKVEKLAFFQISSMALVQKWPFFQLFLCNISQKSVFYDFLQRKNAFSDYKKNTFKKQKNWHFSKGVNPSFRTKNGHFSIFFFGNIAQENVPYDILQRKNAFLGYKKKKYKKVQKLTFFQSLGVNPWFWSKNHYFSTFFLRQYRPGKCLLRYSRTKKTPF